MARIPHCNLHPECSMFPTSVLVHVSSGEMEIFDAYRCQKSGCIRHYALNKGYFDITEPEARFIEDTGARSRMCPADKEVLVIVGLNSGYVYRCPVEDCDYAEPYESNEHTSVSRPRGCGPAG